MSRRVVYVCDNPGCPAFCSPAVGGNLPAGWKALGPDVHVCPSCNQREPRVPAPDPELIQDSSKDLAARILRVVAEHFALRQKDLTGDRRTRHVVWPRQVACYLIRTETTLSFPSIGRVMGGRDHTSILHACKRVESRKGETGVAEVLALLQRRLRED